MSQKSHVVLYIEASHTKYTEPLMFENLYQARHREPSVAGCGVVVCAHAVFSAAVAALLAELLVPPHVLPAATQVFVFQIAGFFQFLFSNCLFLLTCYALQPRFVARCC